MKIIDTYPALLSAFNGDVFNFEKWKAYIDTALPGTSDMFVSDMKKCLDTRAFSEEDFLSVLNAVAQNPELREKAHSAFCEACENLESTVYEKFKKRLNTDIVFYLGLCNGAGWVTEFQGRTAVFLGIEKIMELNWCGVGDMYGLIYHELGHAYQNEYGILERRFENNADAFLWQLFTEGIAMYFEQTLVGDPDFYHQDKDGWKQWCDKHFEEIKADFNRDLKTMTFENQRYFGDWVKYRGRGDVGYYLGCRFVRNILSSYKFDDIICFDIETVAKLYGQFIQ